MTHLISLLFFILLSSQTFAKNETLFIWKSDGPMEPSGTCYQVDQKTKGEVFSIKVKDKKCRPQKTFYDFKKIGKNRAKCYEVDSETGGLNYIKKVRIKYCRPKNTDFIIANFENKTNCYEVDSKTQGKEFYKKVRDKKCNSLNEENIRYLWGFVEDGKGSCFKTMTRENEELKLKVKDEHCRPKETIYNFIREDATSGICVEEAKAGKEYYSVKTKTENCRPDKTIYVFYKEEDKKTGKCYEIDSETKGNFYINIVEEQLCVP